MLSSSSAPSQGQVLPQFKKEHVTDLDYHIEVLSGPLEEIDETQQMKLE